jgi:hypothetical protein
MYKFIVCVCIHLLFSCAANDKACEDVTIAAEQTQACQLLKKQIDNAQGRPIIRTELERRYQQDCIESRYYRDDKQSGICGNKKQVEQVEQRNKQ